VPARPQRKTSSRCEGGQRFGILLLGDVHELLDEPLDLEVALPAHDVGRELVHDTVGQHRGVAPPGAGSRAHRLAAALPVLPVVHEAAVLRPGHVHEDLEALLEGEVQHGARRGVVDPDHVAAEAADLGEVLRHLAGLGKEEAIATGPERPVGHPFDPELGVAGPQELAVHAHPCRARRVRESQTGLRKTHGWLFLAQAPHSRPFARATNRHYLRPDPEVEPGEKGGLGRCLHAFRAGGGACADALGAAPEEGRTGLVGGSAGRRGLDDEARHPPAPPAGEPRPRAVARGASSQGRRHLDPRVSDQVAGEPFAEAFEGGSRRVGHARQERTDPAAPTIDGRPVTG
jgi:hypothetical protein